MIRALPLGPSGQAARALQSARVLQECPSLLCRPFGRVPLQSLAILAIQALQSGQLDQAALAVPDSRHFRADQDFRVDQASRVVPAVRQRSRHLQEDRVDQVRLLLRPVPGSLVLPSGQFVQAIRAVHPHHDRLSNQMDPAGPDVPLCLLAQPVQANPFRLSFPADRAGLAVPVFPDIRAVLHHPAHPFRPLPLAGLRAR